MERTFSGYKLQCVLIEGDSGSSDPTQYCFEPDSSILRYNRGWGWFQTVYNQILTFQERNLAREVDVTDGGKPYLKLRVETIELLSLWMRRTSCRRPTRLVHSARGYRV